MTKYLPSIGAAFALLITAFAQPVQNWLSAAGSKHPVIALGVALAAVVAAHWLPSPNVSTSAGAGK